MISYPRPIIVSAIGQQRYKEGTALIIEGLQCRELNKQLFFNLLDVILVELFPELVESDRQEWQCFSFINSISWLSFIFVLAGIINNYLCVCVLKSDVLKILYSIVLDLDPIHLNWSNCTNTIN